MTPDPGAVGPQVPVAAGADGDPWGNQDGAEVIRRLPIACFLGFRVRPSQPGTYSVEMPITAATNNPAGVPHGGAVATLIDHAGGFLANRGFDGHGPTADLHIRYLAAPRGGLLRADARALRRGRRLVIVEIRVVDAEDRLVAIGTLSVAPPLPPAAPAPH